MPGNIQIFKELPFHVRSLSYSNGISIAFSKTEKMVAHLHMKWNSLKMRMNEEGKKEIIVNSFVRSPDCLSIEEDNLVEIVKSKGATMATSKKIIIQWKAKCSNGRCRVNQTQLLFCQCKSIDKSYIELKCPLFSSSRQCLQWSHRNWWAKRRSKQTLTTEYLSGKAQNWWKEREIKHGSQLYKLVNSQKNAHTKEKREQNKRPYEKKRKWKVK